MALIWKEFELPLPRWKRLFAVDQQTGQIFMAAALSGTEEYLVTIRAADDSQAVHLHEEHYYVPASWMAKEFPKLEPFYGHIAASISAQ